MLLLYLHIYNFHPHVVEETGIPCNSRAEKNLTSYLVQ